MSFENYFEAISKRLTRKEHEKLLKELLETFEKGGEKALKEKIKELTSEVR